MTKWLFVMGRRCPSSTRALPSWGGERSGQGHAPDHTSHSRTPRLYTSLSYMENGVYNLRERGRGGGERSSTDIGGEPGLHELR